jgi:hypothetical protein
MRERVEFGGPAARLPVELQAGESPEQTDDRAQDQVRAQIPSRAPACTSA